MIEKMLQDTKVRILIACVAISIVLITWRGIATGLDLQGGSTIIIQAERPLDAREMDQVITIMDERLRGAFGVRDVKVRAMGDQNVRIEIAGVRPEDAEKLIGKPGKLQVRIGNISVFTGDQLERVDPFGFQPSRGSWGVPFTISDEAAQKFRDAAIATNFARVYMYMDEGTEIRAFTLKEIPRLEEFLEKEGLKGDIRVIKGNATVVTTIEMDVVLEELGDRKEKIIDYINTTANLTDITFARTGLVNDAPIGESLKAELAAGQVVKSLILETGAGDKGREEAKRIEVILRSGALPIKVDIVGSFSISPTLGENFTKNAIMAGILAFLGISVFIYLRYREPIIVLPILATGASEVIMILGFASLIRWNIDLPAIAGIIAALGTGMDNQIVIIDEVIGEKERSIRYRIKSAFFVIMGSYFTILVAMTALFFIGMALLKGFAFTTIVGATAGVFISRPAYARIIEYILKKKVK
jgi:preprotein translocase subunit SecD